MKPSGHMFCAYVAVRNAWMGDYLQTGVLP